MGLNAGPVGTISAASGVVALISILPGCRVTIDRSGRSATKIAKFEEAGSEDSEATAVRGHLSQPSSEAPPEERLGNAFLVGMMIRLAGTVALFLASSYYLDATFLERSAELPAEPPTPPAIDPVSSGVTAIQIAAWVLGWHLALLLTEVVALAREIQQINLNDLSC